LEMMSLELLSPAGLKPWSSQSQTTNQVTRIIVTGAWLFFFFFLSQGLWKLLK
jgi:hypothetical protein